MKRATIAAALFVVLFGALALAAPSNVPPPGLTFLQQVQTLIFGAPYGTTHGFALLDAGVQTSQGVPVGANGLLSVECVISGALSCYDIPDSGYTNIIDGGNTFCDGGAANFCDGGAYTVDAGYFCDAGAGAQVTVVGSDDNTTFVALSGATAEAASGGVLFDPITTGSAFVAVQVDAGGANAGAASCILNQN